MLALALLTVVAPALAPQNSPFAEVRRPVPTSTSTILSVALGDLTVTVHRTPSSVS